MAPINSTPYLLLVLLSVTSLLRSGLAANARCCGAAGSGSGRSSVSARSGAADSSSTAEAVAAARARRSRVCTHGYANYSTCMRGAYQLKLDALAALEELDVEHALALVHDSRALVADQCARHERTLLACCPSLGAKNAQPTAVKEAPPAPPQQRTPERPAGGKLRRSSSQSMCDVARNDLQNMASQMGRLSLQIDDATNRVFAKLTELDSEKEEAS